MSFTDSLPVAFLVGAAFGAALERAGLGKVEYFNMAAGVVALHRGYKF